MLLRTVQVGQQAREDLEDMEERFKHQITEHEVDIQLLQATQASMALN